MDEIFAMRSFDGASLKSVLSALSTRMPDLKVVSAFWKMEVADLKELEQLDQKTVSRYVFFF
jgi:hypothetical protein